MSRMMALFLGIALVFGGCQAAEDVFSWRQCQGQTIRVMMDSHPYADGIRRKLGEFEALTGIKVAYIIYPEDRYFHKLEESFISSTGKPDVYMTGAYQVWQYAPADRMAPLDPFVVNPSKTRVSYNLADFFPNISGAFRWNGKPGAKLGDGPLWAVPIGFETTALTFNREVLTKYRLRPPETLEELLEIGRQLNHFEGPDTYGVGTRGMGAWNSLHSGYLTALANYGGQDMAVENGKLVSKVNSPETVAVTDMWVTLLRECGAPDWEFFDWYRCLKDVGDRKTALLLDSDILGYYANSPGASSQSGKLGLAPPPRPADKPATETRSNLWVWGLAINPETPHPDAAWLFIQYFTSREFQLWSVLEWKSINPPRRSVFEDPKFQLAMVSMEGFLPNVTTLIDNTSIFFTPTPYFFAISERWAAVIRDIANGMYGSTQEGMDTLKIWMDNKLSDLVVE